MGGCVVVGRGGMVRDWVRYRARYVYRRAGLATGSHGTWRAGLATGSHGARRAGLAMGSNGTWRAGLVNYRKLYMVICNDLYAIVFPNAYTRVCCLEIEPHCHSLNGQRHRQRR